MLLNRQEKVKGPRIRKRKKIKTSPLGRQREEKFCSSQKETLKIRAKIREELMGFP